MNDDTLYDFKFQLSVNKDIVMQINNQCYAVGDKLNKYGIIDSEISERFIRIIIYLTLRKYYKPYDCWVDAEEIAWIIDGSSVGGVRKFLERRLAHYKGTDRLPENKTHLIEYMPSRVIKHKRIGGISRGPYRLGVHLYPTAIDTMPLWSYLIGRSEINNNESNNNEFEYDPYDTDFYSLIRRIDSNYSFQYSRYITINKIKKLYYKPSSPLSKHYKIYLANQWITLAHIEMQLGFSYQSIQAAIKAREYYKTLKYPMGVAYSYAIESNALGQLNYALPSVHAAQYSLSAINDSSKRLRTNIFRGECIGIYGQHLSHYGEYKKAERKLLNAINFHEKYGGIEWNNLWYIRLVQNALRSNDALKAEYYLNSIRPDDSLMYTRVLSDFYSTIKDWNQAEKWLNKSFQLAYKYQMSNQLKRLRTILNKFPEIKNNFFD
ncbi:hypothetical protein MHK_002130 [Candidatus Magnetomorum sp. HK-1]|nr:hypothetical protein MHK_002130 [Candidatus Magnetomorum sp. HK-1]